MQHMIWFLNPSLSKQCLTVCYLYFADEQLRFREIKWFASGIAVDLTPRSCVFHLIKHVIIKCFIFYKMLPCTFSYMIHSIDVETEYSSYEAYRYKAKMCQVLHWNPFFWVEILPPFPHILFI